MLGSKNNKYTTTNAATNITKGIQEAVAAVVSKSNKKTTMTVAEVQATLIAKVDKLTEALALIAQATVANKENQQPHHQRKEESKISKKANREKRNPHCHPRSNQERRKGPHRRQLWLTIPRESIQNGEGVPARYDL